MKFLPNQNVSLIKLVDGTYRVISKQDRSTPGCYMIYSFIENKEYKIVVNGTVETDCKVILWVLNIENYKFILKSFDYDLNKGNINYTFKSYGNFKTHVGLMIIDAKINDSFHVKSFNIIENNNKIEQINNVNKYKLNDFFDNIFIINLKRRPDRLDKIKTKMHKYNIKYEIIEAIDGKDSTIINMFNNLNKNSKLNNSGELGCIMSHIKAISLAIERNYKNILILEDDILIHKNIDSMLWKINTIPANWELLYLGCSQSYLSHNYNILKNFSYCKVNKGTFGTFAYALSNKVYDIIINKLNEYNSPADICLNILIERDNSYSIFEYLFIADLNNSDIQNTQNKIPPPNWYWNTENYE